MRNPYDILGVSKSAPADEIKSAYRKLAKKLHPDVNPGRKDIEQKFKEVTAAYDLLSDTEKRKRFDRGEIDEQGNDRGFGGGGGSSWRPNPSSQRGSGADPFSQFGDENLDDILSQFMGGNRTRRGAGANASPMHGGDITYSLAVPFVEASLGGKRRVTLAGGKTIDITVPPGTAEGHKLRLRGQGQAGGRGAGDAIIEIHIEPHPFFTRKDNDISLDVPVSLTEAVVGASIQVPTLDGHVSVKVPKGANTDATLRLKGKGVPTGKDTFGDMFVKLKIMLPDTVPADLTELIEKWSKKNPYNPRKKLGWD